MKRMNAPPAPKFSHGERSRSQSPAHHGSDVDQEDVLDEMDDMRIDVGRGGGGGLLFE